MAQSVDADSDFTNEDEDYSQEEEHSDDNEEMSEPAAASAHVVPGNNKEAINNTEQIKAFKKPNFVKTKKDRYNDAMKYRKLMQGKPVEKWKCAALKAECLYKKQKGDRGVPEKKAELLAMYKVRCLRPSPPCSDAEDSDEEETEDEKVEGYDIMAPTTSKNTLPEASLAIKTPATSDLKLPASSSNVAGPPVKRGRGRPRKYPLPQSLQAGTTTSVIGPQSSAPSNLVEPVKRGRGMSRLQNTTMEKPSSPSDAAKGATASVPTPAGATLVSPTPSVGTKRGRLEDDEVETSRRVSQRTNDEDSVDEEDSAMDTDTMDELVLNGLLTNDEDDLFKTLKKINYLLYDTVNDKAFEEAQNDFFQVGGHLVVVRVLQKHLGCVPIQQWGASVLTSACFDNPTIKQAIGRVGGLQAILDAMKKAPKGSDGYIYRAIGALGNLITLEANAEMFVTKTDGISLVLKYMKSFSNDDGIIHEACFLFLTLCKHEQLRSKLDDASVGTALMVAYDKNKDDAQIREKAKAAITLLFE